MKKMLIMLLAVLSVFAIANGVLAADESNSAFYMDYSQLSNDSDLKSSFITVGGDYSANHLLLGASYSDAVRFSPDSSGLAANYLLLYAGYNFLESDTNVLGLIGGFGTASSNDALGKLDATSFLIGFRGAYKQDAFSASLSYLYGVKNTIKIDNLKENDPKTSYLELKLGYDFTDNFGLYLVYRDDMLKMKNATGDNNGFGIGAQFRF